MVVHLLRADSDFVVAIQLEKAPAESWDRLLELDFHVAVLDAAAALRGDGTFTTRCSPLPPAGDGTLASRLEPWLSVYRQPSAELSRLVGHFAALCRKHHKVAGALLGDHQAAALYQSLGVSFIGIGSDLMVLMERGGRAAAIASQRNNGAPGWRPALSQLRRGQASAIGRVLGIASGCVCLFVQLRSSPMGATKQCEPCVRPPSF